MNEANRDLLVLANEAHLSPAERERQLTLLNSLLYHLETWDVFCMANEIIDINRHKIIRKPFLIQQVLKEKIQKPFVFTCNKN